jgi:hypothetical protein
MDVVLYDCEIGCEGGINTVDYHAAGLLILSANKFPGMMLVIWENSVNFTMGVWVLVRTLKITRKGNTQLPLFS